MNVFDKYARKITKNFGHMQIFVIKIAKMYTLARILQVKKQRCRRYVCIYLIIFLRTTKSHMLPGWGVLDCVVRYFVLKTNKRKKIMRTEIFNPENIQVCLTTNKYKNLVTVHILDLRLPAGTEVETEETATYGPTPMYYADDCCMVSAAFIARIVRETLHAYFDRYFIDYVCHVYTPYSTLVDEASWIYHKKNHIRLHSGYDPSKWRRPNKLVFEFLYRRAELAIAYLMQDLQSGSFTLSEITDDYILPYDIFMDYDLAECKYRNSAEFAMLNQS